MKHVNSICCKLDLPETADVSRRVTVTLIFLAEQDGDVPVDLGSVGRLYALADVGNEPGGAGLEPSCRNRRARM